MSDIKAIVIRGDFTEAEFARLVALIRGMDDARPDAHFHIIAVAPEQHSLEIADQLMHRMVPEQPGRTTEWSTWRRKT
jgi:hypothetical protein